MPEFICTKENPWDPSKGKRATHPDADEVRDSDYRIWYKCPHCNHSFSVELPD